MDTAVNLLARDIEMGKQLGQSKAGGGRWRRPLLGKHHSESMWFVNTH
jgi:hypothetical protein